MAATKEASPLPPRDKVVQLIAGMALRKGQTMVTELRRRVAANESIQVSGISVDVGMIQEALAHISSQDSPGEAASPCAGTTKSHPADSPAASSRPASPDAPGSPFATPSPASARWTPKGSAGAARWMPSAPSASLLAQRALMECEQAEAFSRSVRVVGGAKVGVLKKPDVAGETSGAHLADGEVAEVIARFACHSDGRVYLRLKGQEGWVSTRSRKNYDKIVMASADGDASLEPPKWSEAPASPAMRLLPVLDAAAVEKLKAASPRARRRSRALDRRLSGASASQCSQDHDGEAEEAGDHASEGEASAEIEEGGAGDVEAAGEYAEFDHDEDDAPHEEEEEEEELGGDDCEDEQVESEALHEDVPEEEPHDTDVGPGSPVLASPVVDEGHGNIEADALAQPASSQLPRQVVPKPRKFRVVANRVSVLDAPGNIRLASKASAKDLLKKHEFWADGVFFVQAEHRAYLHLRNGRGWVCERSRTELRRLAVSLAPSRKGPVDRKTAKRIAFQGGDAGCATKLRKEDLVKNKAGKIVSKKLSENSKKRYADGIGKWTTAVKKAREELGLKGFVPVKKGSEVYERAREIYKQQPPT